MNMIQKSEAIKNGLRKGFQDGTSKMAQRKCYGYDVGADGELAINPNEAAVVRWIFNQYLIGSSLGAIAVGVKKKGVPSPTGKPNLYCSILCHMYPFAIQMASGCDGMLNYQVDNPSWT